MYVAVMNKNIENGNGNTERKCLYEKAGICTIVILVFAALAVWIYRSGNHDEKTPVQGKGTLVKEYKEWKRYYM